jgi:tetratricopeptide (TPR) repeat protein
MLTLIPFESFSLDADALQKLGKKSPLPTRWLSAAQVAFRLAEARREEREELLREWTAQEREDGEHGIWAALAIPGIPITDLRSAVRALCAIAVEMERNSALHLAYATVTNARLAVFDGPMASRGLAALHQARVLRQMGYHEEAQDTYEWAAEDAVEAGDRELEARALLGLAVLAGQQGNYPKAIDQGKGALAIFPEKSEYVADAHITLLAAYSSTSQFPAALEHGWRGFDAAADDAERRASLVSNLSSVALRMGRLHAARRGFFATLGMCELDRIVLPTLGGLAMANAASGDHTELALVAQRIELRAITSAQPYEVARTMFELAQAWEQSGQVEESKQCLTRARELALRHGFHEVTFRSELLAEALAAAERTPTRHERVEQSIARFDELVVDESILAGV